MLLPKLGRTRDALESLFHERRLKPTISMELDSSELLKRFVAANVGIGFIPRSNVAEDLQAKTLVALTIPTPASAATWRWSSAKIRP